MIRRPPRSTLSSSSAASDVYKRQLHISQVFDHLCWQRLTIHRCHHLFNLFWCNIHQLHLHPCHRLSCFYSSPFNTCSLYPSALILFSSSPILSSNFILSLSSISVELYSFF